MIFWLVPLYSLRNPAYMSFREEQQRSLEGPQMLVSLKETMPIIKNLGEKMNPPKSSRNGRGPWPIGIPHIHRRRWIGTGNMLPDTHLYP